MLSVIFAVGFSVCTNCVGVGSVDIVCSNCGGSGVVAVPRLRSQNRQNAKKFLSPGVVACPKCTRGLVKSGSKGAGKVRSTCPVCKGQKKIKIAP